MMQTTRSAELVTLRNLPPELAEAIRKRARDQGISLNKAVIGLLQEHLAPLQKKKLHHDLDALAGSWTRQEANQFDKALAAQRSIDPDLWR